MPHLGERRRRRSHSRSRSRSRERAPPRRRHRHRSRSESPPSRRRRRYRSRSPSFRRRSRRSRSRERRRRRSRSRSRSPRRHHGVRSALPAMESSARRQRRSRTPVKTEKEAAVIVEATVEVVGETSAAVLDGGEAPPPAPLSTDTGIRRSSRGRGGRRSAPRSGKPRQKKLSIPENWTDVPKMGALIGTSRFLPMRVPLDDKYTHLLKASDDLWSPQRFLEDQAAEGHDVRMVIDLTNTFKYYDGVSEFADSPAEYVKLKIEGFRGPPAAHDVARFMEIVDAFVAKEPVGAIAVHCTHGLNRTGYLIVNYMVERQGCTVAEALAAFAVARPPGLIKHMYVEELFKRLGPSEDVQLPELPDWAANKYGKRKH